MTVTGIRFVIVSDVVGVVDVLVVVVVVVGIVVIDITGM